MRKHKHAIWIVGMLLAFAMLMQQGTMGKVHAEDWKNDPAITFQEDDEIKIQIQKASIAEEYLPGATLKLTCVNSDNEEVRFYAALNEGSTDVGDFLKSATLNVDEGGQLINGPVDRIGYFKYLQWMTGKEDATVTFKLSNDLWNKLNGNPDEYIEFILHEDNAPTIDGVQYALASDIKFRIRINGGKLEWQGLDYSGQGEDPTFKVTMIDDVAGPDPITISINKTDITGDEELAGAQLQILDQNGNVVKIAGKGLEWTSVKGKKWEVTGLTADETYILRETVAPDGYTISTDTKFELDEQGKITVLNPSGTTATVDKDGVLLVKDTLTSVKISKVEINGDVELEGATLQILDGGNVVEEWVSGKTPHEVKGLTTGKKYTLRETVAPTGYKISTDTTFVLKADGTIDSSQTTTTVKDGVLLVEDTKLDDPKPEDTPISVKISKVDITNGGVELEGATLQILDEDGNVVEINGVKQEWVSGKTPHEVVGLTAGKKYTLRETVAPDGYEISADTTFVLKADGTIDTEKTTTTVKNGVLLVEDTKSGDGNKEPDEKTTDEKPAEQKTNEEKTTTVTVESTQSPKTGDSTNLWVYMLLMSLFAGTNFFLCVKRKSALIRKDKSIA